MNSWRYCHLGNVSPRNIREKSVVVCHHQYAQSMFLRQAVGHVGAVFSSAQAHNCIIAPSAPNALETIFPDSVEMGKVRQGCPLQIVGPAQIADVIAVEEHVGRLSRNNTSAAE
jgi:hypothetical protein